MEIERTGDEWIATLEKESLYLWGTGVTEGKVIDDLVYVPGEVRDSHRRFADGLTPYPERELQLLEDMTNACAPSREDWFFLWDNAP